MKYKLLSALTVLLAAAVTVGVLAYQAESGKTVRIHQHRIAGEKPPCTLNHSDGSFCTHLPILSIETGGQTIPGGATEETDLFGERVYEKTEDGEDKITVRIREFDRPDVRNHLSDVPTFEGFTRIRIRGHSSRRFEKASYLLNLTDEAGEELAYPLLGMDAHEEWALHGPYLDKSLIRNYMFYNLSGEIMEYAPNCRFLELFVDGDYRGVYLLTETVTGGKNCRLRLSAAKKGVKLDGYLLRVDRPTEEDLESLRDVNTFAERAFLQMMDVAVRFPRRGSMTEKFRKQIELEYSAYEKALYSFDFDEGDFSYGEYIDADNYAEYAVITLFSLNNDAGRFSTYIYKPPGGKYKLVVWDFNNACDNYVSDPSEADDDLLHMFPYFSMLFRDRRFGENVIRKYRELRKSFLSEEAVDRYIDETVAFLKEAAERNSVRWAEYLASDPLSDPEERGRNPHSYEEAVEKLREDLRARGRWLDENIDYLLQYSAVSAGKRYFETPH